VDCLLLSRTSRFHSRLTSSSTSVKTQRASGSHRQHRRAGSETNYDRGENWSLCSLERSEAVSGNYPLDLSLLIYLRRVPGQSLDPLARIFAFILSKEGNTIAAAAPGYLPLNAREVREELAKLE